jgi:hypothetical protein
MSIAITISNPINDEESKFYIPFSTQLCYKEVWLKGSENLNLELIPLLDGLDISKEEWANLKCEIQQMMLWVNNNLDNEYQDEIHERASFVINTIDVVFKRDDAIVNFG